MTFQAWILTTLTCFQVNIRIIAYWACRYAFLSLLIEKITRIAWKTQRIRLTRQTLWWTLLAYFSTITLLRIKCAQWTNLITFSYCPFSIVSGRTLLNASLMQNIKQWINAFSTCVNRGTLQTLWTRKTTTSIWYY